MAFFLRTMLPSRTEVTTIEANDHTVSIQGVDSTARFRREDIIALASMLQGVAAMMVGKIGDAHQLLVTVWLAAEAATPYSGLIPYANMF